MTKASQVLRNNKKYVIWFCNNNELFAGAASGEFS